MEKSKFKGRKSKKGYGLFRTLREATGYYGAGRCWTEINAVARGSAPATGAFFRAPAEKECSVEPAADHRLAQSAPVAKAFRAFKNKAQPRLFNPGEGWSIDRKNVAMSREDFWL